MIPLGETQKKLIKMFFQKLCYNLLPFILAETFSPMQVIVKKLDVWLH
jgi:hypothetical protein